MFMIKGSILMIIKNHDRRNNSVFKHGIIPSIKLLCVKSANFANPNEMEKEDSEKRCIVISGSYVGRLRKQRHAEFL